MRNSFSSVCSVLFLNLAQALAFCAIVITFNCRSYPADLSFTEIGRWPTFSPKSSITVPFTRITTGEIVTDTGLFYGGAWGDFDDDGFIDLFVTNEEASKGNLLYRNLGDGTFTRMGRESFNQTVDVISGTGIWGDVDNDGDLDLFLPNACCDRPLQDFFYRNNADHTFTQITEGDFVNDRVPGNNASWADYDNDGFLDLFVSNGRNNRNFLYRNRGDGTFQTVTNTLTLDAHHSHGCSWADYDNDGDWDLFVPNLNANNYLYRNDGNGTFRKITEGPVVTSGGQSEEGAWGDYDNDGDLDLFVVNFPPEQNLLFRNEGGGNFQRVTTGAPVSIGGYGASWADYDNDGYLDLFLFRYSESNLLYRNQGDGSFAEISSGRFFNKPAGAQGGAGFWGDFNNDGFLDLITMAYTGGRQTNQLYRNNGNSNSWIKVKLIGTASNRSAMGAKVKVKATVGGKTLWQLREVTSGGGFGQHDFRANFGLGGATEVETMRIEWPSGTTQEFYNIVAKQILTITEPPKLFVARSSSGEIHLKVLGAPGHDYRISTSADLREWVTWQSVTATNRATQLNLENQTEQPSAASKVRFYRAVEERH